MARFISLFHIFISKYCPFWLVTYDSFHIFISYLYKQILSVLARYVWLVSYLYKQILSVLARYVWLSASQLHLLGRGFHIFIRNVRSPLQPICDLTTYNRLSLKKKIDFIIKV